MSEQLRICLVGASGLIGSRLIAQSLHRPDIRLIGVSRREIALPKGARLEILVSETAGWADAIAAANASVLVCALGTTWKRASGSEAAFRSVDHDLVLQCAQAAKAAGIGHMVLVSSVAADPASKRLYLRVKGETERDVSRLRFRRLDILRPGLLRGHREETRPLERLAAIAAPITDPLMLGGWRKYRSIHADTLSRAIFALCAQKAAGQFVHEHDAILYALRRAAPRTGLRAATS